MKERLDVFLVNKGFYETRNKAQNAIESNDVKVNGVIINSSSHKIDEEAKIEIVSVSLPYVSRGGLKLEKAIKVFNLDLKDKTILDIGASTGGFTDCSLQNGAKKVYSVDVGKGELAAKLVADKRVVNMQQTDIRILTKDMVPDVEVIVGDLSFISLKHILPKIKSIFGKIECVLLFKPQFECGKELAKKSHGVVKQKSVHKDLLKDFLEEIKTYDYNLSNITFSPIKGKSGNVEYLLHLNGILEIKAKIDKVVDEAFEKAK